MPFNDLNRTILAQQTQSVDEKVTAAEHRNETDNTIEQLID